MVTSLVVSSCSANEDHLLNAQCSNDVLTSKVDAVKMQELAPEDLDRLEPRFVESESRGYSFSCTVGDRTGSEGLAVALDADFVPNRTLATKTSLNEIIASLPSHNEGRLVRLTSGTRGVGGASSEAGAVLLAPCALSQSKTLPPDFRKGAMRASAWAPNAPDADSLEQRQNAADLALSILRHAVQQCDDPPKLPESMQIE
ncbi:hypothetical protein RM572_05980 [Streptomyces sp. DSM 42041]|uniref:DUF3558 domain-containing protein n=1 Tax=Streptomyces hazeniae TaxID=3075538 RepID=A0ABU2NN06_9ACTN|nr:hypothetical protein [Streptomyces sp. DSM 42041]MDT0378328.1 hypothetical protein [Streptomyces sp. DSM 42041]